MENKFKYDIPTQIKFIAFDASILEPTWLGGIAYGTDIICGCCGAAFEIFDYLTDWDEFKSDSIYDGIDYPIVEYKEWNNIEEAIRGDDDE